MINDHLPAPGHAAIADQMAACARQLIESGAKYSEIAEQARETMRMLAEMERRDGEKREKAA